MEKDITRPTWIRYYLTLAEAVSTRGECTRRQVGAVIVKDQIVVSTGYNGAPAGKPSCLDGHCPRATSDATPGTDYAETGCHVIHAEANALLRTSKERLIGATIYVTEQPCVLCTQLIQAAGIENVVHPGTSVADVMHQAVKTAWSAGDVPDQWTVSEDCHDELVSTVSKEFRDELGTDWLTMVMGIPLKIVGNATLKGDWELRVRKYPIRNLFAPADAPVSPDLPVIYNEFTHQYEIEDTSTYVLKS